MRSVRRPFSSSYLADDDGARAFLPLDFRVARDRIGKARAAAERARALSPALAASLRVQNGRLPASGARADNLEALVSGRAAVVATGQQVGLFLGPLYGFYKAATAVVVARVMEAESGVRCVPLFWLQTEDHDYAEIAAATVADDGGSPVTLALAPERDAEARVSIAHRRLGDEASDLVEKLAALLGAGDPARHAIDLLRAHYRPGRPLADAFAGAMAALFGEEGLLFLDPRVAPVARLAAPIYRRALETAATIETTLAERRAALDAAGFAEQIPARAGCALVFHHLNDATGPRFRLKRPSAGAPPGRGGGGGEGGGDAGWCLAGADERVSEAEIARLLADDPLRFSTSALLRPIVQDSILPVAAYVGGPAEISYFAELAPLHPHFDLPPPLIVPRARFRVIDGRCRRLLRELDIVPDDLARPSHELRARVTPRERARRPAENDADPAALIRRVTDEITPAVNDIAAAIASADPADRNLVRAAERTRATVAHALRRLTDRYARKLAERDQAAIRRLDRLRAALLPGGVPQERVYAWPSFAGRIGPGPFKRLVLERLEAVGPFGASVHDLDA